MSKASQKSTPRLVVGVGASAGGLSEFKTLVKSLPEKSGMAFILVQHLEPSHKSMLPELLERETEIPVSAASDGLKLESDHIYVIPPNCYIELNEGAIHLTEPKDRDSGIRQAIDHFFRSLASDCGERCAGIVLSGAASDGTAGLRAIRAAGGLALAQEPDSAKHPSMPESAVRAEVVDIVAEVKDMPNLLTQYADHPMTFREDHETHRESEEDDESHSAEISLKEITSILKVSEDFDVKQYKPSTVQRRIARRMGLTNISEYSDYLEKLRSDRKERKLLTKDLLINVTDFFRDKDAFDALKTKVIPDILSNVEDNDDIRVWVAGCATGEEAYSITILLLEALNRAGMNNAIKVFATDISQDAIKIARKGVYSGSIANEIPKEYLDQYFSQFNNEHYFKVRGFLRDHISFATQNVANDPPFNQMHLIACRNLLIYLSKEAQLRVLNSFYFALGQPGYLFLGSSETIGERSDYYRTISKKWRLYQKLPGQKQQSPSLRHLHSVYGSSHTTEEQSERSRRERGSAEMTRAQRIRLALLDAVAPPSIVVDQNGQILYMQGDLDSHIRVPKGEPHNDITEYLRPSMRSRVRSGLYRARKDKQRVTLNCALDDSKPGEEESGKTVRQMIRVELVPMDKQDFCDGTAVSISFHSDRTLSDLDLADVTRDEEQRATKDLEKELAETRHELRHTIEELETSTEELKASHEEALSTNEELQSSNEELEASSEELRSLNEELSTVNEQLKEKLDELRRANNDAENFFASTDLPTLFLDPRLRIKRYTPAAEHLLKMGPLDIDRNIQSLGRDLIDEKLTEECENVLRTFQPIRTEKQDYQGRWFIRQVTPYRTEERRIEGVVIVFQDITELRDLNQRAEGREKQQGVVARLGMLALSGAKPQELMDQAVRQIAHTLKADYCKVLQFRPEQEDFLLVSGIGWQESLVGHASVPNDKGSQAGFTMVASEPVIVRNLADEKRFIGPDLLVEHGVVSGMSCVINHSDPPFGVLGVHTRDEREFSAEDGIFLQSVANLLSNALRTANAQAELHTSEDKFRNLANSIPQLAWMTDASGYIFWYNSRWYEYTGSNHEEMKGWGWTKVHHPDHVKRVVPRFKQHIEDGKEWEDTFPLRDKNGEYRWFLSRAKPIHDDDGKIVRWFGTNTDVTETREQAEALRRSEERLRMAKDSGRLGLHYYDVESGKLEWDALLYEIWGFEPGQPVMLNDFISGLHPDDVEKAQQAVEASLDPDGDHRYAATYRVVQKHTQKIFWVKAVGTVQFKDRRAVNMSGLVEDITEQENTRAQLTRSEERMRFVLESNRIGVWEHDFQTNATTRTIEHDRIYGYEELAPDWNYEIFLQHVHPDDKARVDQRFQEALESKIWDLELRVIRVSDGEIRWVWARGQIKGVEGLSRKMSGLIIDITERKALENRLRSAINELEEADQKKNDFLSILGHELRNPLAALSGGLGLIKETVDGEIYELMKHGVKSMSKLLDDLLDLRRVSRNEIQIEISPINLRKSLHNAFKLVEERMEENGQSAEIRIPEDVWIDGDAVRVEQIFTNLLINASKYSPEGSRIQLVAERRNAQIVIEVTDNGIGFDPDLSEQIFDPFYQIKQDDAANSGLGIGLALCRKLVELHDGTIVASSEGVGSGSTFTVTLPAREPAPAENTDPAPEPADIRGLKVLVVEDNPGLLLTFSRLIKKVGCEVETATNGKEALQKTGVFKPDAALVDIGLPDLTGHEVGEALRKQGFNGLLVALSGYSHEESRQKSEEVGFDQHLAKPASLEQLVEVLATAKP